MTTRIRTTEVKEITHMCPPDGASLMPCCGRTPFEADDNDRITRQPARVTCGKETSGAPAQQ